MFLTGDYVFPPHNNDHCKLHLYLNKYISVETGKISRLLVITPT
jgi:hypothetical protein